MVTMSSLSSDSWLAPLLQSGTATPTLQAPPTTDNSRSLSPQALFNRTMFGLALAFAVVSVVGLVLVRATVPTLPLLVRAAPAVLVLAGIPFYRWRQVRRLEELLTAVFWSLLFGILYAAPMYLAARLPIPFQDNLLAQMDRSLGVEVPDVLSWMEAFPALQRVLAFCYDTLLFLVVAAIMLPPLCGQWRRTREYLLAGVASAVLAIPLFALLPAQGPWVHYGYPASATQENVTRVIQTLKSGERFFLNYLAPEGIISFPSFHTVLALLAAYALWSVRYVRWPAALLAGLIVLSTVTTGWHYLIDTWAGLFTAVSSIALAKAYSQLEDRWAGTCSEPESSPGVLEQSHP
jgi:hypothetical protein